MSEEKKIKDLTRAGIEGRKTDKKLFPVTSLGEGEEGVIHSISGGFGFMSRLAGMGIVPGTEIKVLRNSRGPVNVLTGLSQHVGNWPGKTVEKKEGIHVYDNVEMRIIDLPGTYSLTAFSEEEKIARDFVINERPEVMVLTADATALERSLYLLSELLLLDSPVIVAVNMTDVAEDQGIHIDTDSLQNCLGIPVIPMVASKNKGIKELLQQVLLLSDGKLKYDPKIPDISQDHRDIFLKLTELTREHIPAPYTARWAVTKLMEGDPEILRMIEDSVPVDKWSEIKSLLLTHEDSLRAVVGGRYDWIETVTRASFSP